MSKNKSFCKVVNNGKNCYRNKDLNINKMKIIDIENISNNPYAHIKEEQINFSKEDHLIATSMPYDTALIKVEINEESNSKHLANVPSIFEEEVSTASSLESEGSLSSAKSPVSSTLNISHQISDGSSSDNLSKTIYIPGRAHAELPTAASSASSSQTLQHYVLINSAPYQMIVPSHGISTSSPQGIIQGSLGKSVQLQLMNKPSNIPQNLKSFKSKPISNVIDTSKSTKQADHNISLNHEIQAKLPYNQLPLDIKKIYFPSHIRAIPDAKDTLKIQNINPIATSSISKDLQKSSLANDVRTKVTCANKLSNEFENDDEERLHMSCQDDRNDNEFSQCQLENNELDLLGMTNSSSLSQENISQGSDSECSIPNLLNDSGKYGFKVYLDDKKDTLKTPTWLMSNITKKLYTNMNKPVPFRVILKKLQNLKRKFNLRAMAVFKYPMFLRHNVVRCPHHLNPMDPSNTDFTDNLNHVIRADHPRAIYERSQSGRLSVIVPLDFPENRKEAVPVLLKFMCHNSCVGGISRRPLAVLLTLELNGEELGRSIIDVRVCACPSRDVRSEEKQVISRGIYKKTISHTFVGRRARKRQRPDDIPNLYDEQDEIMFIPVRGLNLYNYLIEMKSLYLKHHADYAEKYPDPPLEYRPMDDSSPNFNGIIDSHRGESISINDEEAIISHSQSFRSVMSDEPEDPLYLTSRNDVEDQHYVMQSDLQVALLSDDSGDQSENNIQISTSETHSDMTTSEQQSESIYQVDSIQPNGYHYNIKLSTKKHTSSSKKCKNDSMESSSLPNVNCSGSSKDSSKKSNNRKVGRNNLNGNHIQCHSELGKCKSANRKSFNYDSGVHSGDPSSKERDQNLERINESEKVMLAAQVLASHLGSQSIEVHK